jgi:hypothetical protein
VCPKLVLFFGGGTFINAARDVRYSPCPRAMSCSKFSNATAVKSRALWLSVTTPSASNHSSGLVLDVNFANVSTVAFVVLPPETTNTVLARTNTLTSLFNVIVRMSSSSCLIETMIFIDILLVPNFTGLMIWEYRIDGR